MSGVTIGFLMGGLVLVLLVDALSYSARWVLGR